MFEFQVFGSATIRRTNAAQKSSKTNAKKTQCDRIGLFLKVFGNNYFATFWTIFKTSPFKLKPNVDIFVQRL